MGFLTVKLKYKFGIGKQSHLAALVLGDIFLQRGAKLSKKGEAQTQKQKVEAQNKNLKTATKMFESANLIFGLQTEKFC